ncbi:MAG: ion transporter [Verrucomicrobiota bacterium]
MAEKKNSLRERIWRVIFLSESGASRNFDIVLLWLIAISIGVVMLDSMSEVRSEYAVQLDAAEWFFTILFTIEYLTRILVSRRPLRYMFSFFGLVDLLSILPTYISLLVYGAEQLVVIRVLRVLRMFRVFKMVRHMGEARMLMDALRASRPKITVFIFGVITLVMIFGTLLYLIEGATYNPEYAGGFVSIPRSIYWAIVTITTVGYGDITPQTTVGQVLSAMMMIIGYAIIAVPTGIVGAEISRQAKLDDRECDECGAAGHLVSARFCRDCGDELPSRSSSEV